MPQLESKLNPRSDDFKANAAAMQAVVADLHEKVENLRQHVRRYADTGVFDTDNRGAILRQQGH